GDGIRDLNLTGVQTCALPISQTDHIPMSGMHNAVDAVHVVVELTLEYRLEIRLHALSGYLYHVGDAVLAAHFEFVEIFSDQLKAVVFHFGHLFRLYQLAAVHSGTVEFHLHIAFPDDLAFECAGKGHRDIDLGDLDLDVAGLQGGR